MDGFIHIVFGDSAAGILKYFLGENETEFSGNLICFREDFAVGPICEIDTKDGFEKRMEWFKVVFQKTGQIEWFEEYSRGVRDSYERIGSILKGSKIVVWHGENASDQVGLRYVCSLLDENDMYEIEVSKAYTVSRGEHGYIPISLAEIAPEDIGGIISQVRKLESEKHSRLKAEWESLRESEENLRILSGEKIFEVNEEYYDDEILSSCTFNFKKAARVIGRTMGNSDQMIGDLYVDYRLRRLIEDKKVEYRGNLQSMRDFEVRVAYGLDEFFKKLFKKECKKD